MFVDVMAYIKIPLYVKLIMRNDVQTTLYF